MVWWYGRAGAVCCWESADLLEAPGLESVDPFVLRWYAGMRASSKIYNGAQRRLQTTLDLPAKDVLKSPNSFKDVFKPPSNVLKTDCQQRIDLKRSANREQI